MYRLLTLLVYVLAGPLALAQPLTVELYNPTGLDRPAEPVVVAREAFGNVGEGLVPVADGVPSQADDLDGDGTWDEWAFVYTLAPWERATLAVRLVPEAEAPTYPARTNVRIGVSTARDGAFEDRPSEVRPADYRRPPEGSPPRYQMEGPAWENDRVGFRLYFDERNGKDVFGKRLPAPVLDSVGLPGGDYHALADWGLDVLKVGASLGAGALAVVDEAGGLHRLGEADRAEARIVAEGPVRAVLDLDYRGAEAPDGALDYTERVTIWTRHPYFEGAVTPSASRRLAAGLSAVAADTVRAAPVAGGEAVVVAGQSEGGGRLALGLLALGAEGTGQTPDEGEGVTQTAYAHGPAAPDAPFRYRVYAGWGAADPALVTAGGLGAHVAADARRLAEPVRVAVGAGGGAALSPESLLDRAVWRLRPHLAEPAANGAFPRSLGADGATVRRVDREDWTSGFYPALLWQLYAYSGDDALRKAAERWTAPLEPLRTFTDNHDLGFMVGLPVGLGLALEGDASRRDEYRGILTDAARSLATRFDPETGAIRSWDSWLWDDPQPWRSPVIIDNMMNLELLFDAADLIGDGPEADALRAVARSHADVTLEHHFRPDASSYHVVDYDPDTGSVRARVTHQGYADESAWARGQAWGLYGYEEVYRQTGEARYLEQARRIAAYVLDPGRLPADGVPPWDYDAPPGADGHVPRDASAGAVTASALYALAEHVNGDERARYLAAADGIVFSLGQPAYAAPEGVPFLLGRSVGHLPAGSEVSVPINYADYYYVEALVRRLRQWGDGPLRPLSAAVTP